MACREKQIPPSASHAVKQFVRIWENAMAFIPVLNTVRVAMEYTKRGQLVVNVFHVSKSSPIVTVDLSTIADIFLQQWLQNWAPLTVDTQALQRVVVTDISAENGEQFISVQAPGEPGELEESDLPNNCALVVKHLSINTGRSFRGRTYVCGLSEAQVGGDLVLTTPLGDWVSSFQELNDDLQDEGYFHSIVSYVSEGEPRVTGLVSAVVGYDSEGVMDSQRRRLTGRGA